MWCRPGNLSTGSATLNLSSTAVTKLWTQSQKLLRSFLWWYKPKRGKTQKEMRWRQGETKWREMKKQADREGKGQKKMEERRDRGVRLEKEDRCVSWLFCVICSKKRHEHSIVTLTDLKKAWCSTQTFHSLLAALWFSSLKPMVDSNCSNWRQRHRLLICWFNKSALKYTHQQMSLSVRM